MRLKYFQKSQDTIFTVGGSKEKARNLLLALIVVVAVGGTFFHLFGGENPREGLIGNLFSSIVAEGPEKEAEKEVIEKEKEEIYTENVYKEKAQLGEGLTHLARRALEKHFQETGISGYSAEHKVFMEDYIQKALGSEALAVDQEVLISGDLISEAIEEADLLTENELDNLEQYSLLISSI